MNAKLLLILISLILMLVSIVAIFFYAPIERTMGIVQKIFYFHVSSAWVGFLAFGFVFVMSLLFLWKKKIEYDRWAFCSAELGVIFTSLVLLTGPMWAKPVWNTYWTWDPRLTTTLILWLIYVGYLLLRNMVDSPEKAARVAAVYGIIGFVDVPIVYMSIRWWKTLHPEHVMFISGENSGLHPKIFHTLMLSLLTFTFLYLTLLFLRTQLEKIKHEVDFLKRKI
jgi:heme exporter protein C